jgi:membrane glycosyltransferase
MLLLLPRLLNLLRALCDHRVRRGFGGARSLLCGAALEQLFWLLLAPALSLFASIFVVRTLLGQSISWDRQVRSDRMVALPEAVRRHTLHIGVGVLLAAAAVVGGGWYAFWMAPAVIGLCFSPWLTAISSRQDLGRLSHRLGLFLTSDDLEESPELQEIRQRRT